MAWLCPPELPASQVCGSLSLRVTAMAGTWELVLQLNSSATTTAGLWQELQTTESVVCADPGKAGNEGPALPGSVISRSAQPGVCEITN